MKLFWLISQQSRVKLMQYQWKKYGVKLDMQARPEPPPPAVVIDAPLALEEQQMEVAKEMSQAPHGQEKIN